MAGPKGQCSSHSLRSATWFCVLAVVQAVLQRLTDIVAKRGTPVKPFFDDAAADDHSVKMYGHVTIPQFRQCLSTKLQLHITEAEAKVIVKKFGNEDKPEFVNYIAFSNTIDPPKKYWDM